MVWYREEDAGDPKRSELNELVESLTFLNALEGGIWKSDQKIVMDEELVQNDVMDEELVQNSVMDGKFVKNFVMDVRMQGSILCDTVLGTTLCEFSS